MGMLNQDCPLVRRALKQIQKCNDVESIDDKISKAKTVLDAAINQKEIIVNKKKP